MLLHAENMLRNGKIIAPFTWIMSSDAQIMLADVLIMPTDSRVTARGDRGMPRDVYIMLLGVLDYAS